MGYTSYVTRAEAAVKSGLRSAIPVVIVIAGLVATGEIKNWRDLFTLQGLAAVVVAMVGKGALTYGTAKSQVIKDKP